MSKKNKKNHVFIGRSPEQEKLHQICGDGEASLLVVYGRRRVGKTELIETTLKNKKLLKFEGVEGQKQDEQIENFLYQLSNYFKDPKLAKFKFTKWVEAFDLLADFVKEDEWVIYLEEIQWMANYDSRLISDLKITWDNSFRHNSKLTVIMCGSSPSFVINKILHSKALYNRSQHEIHLQEFSLAETQEFLGKNKSLDEVMDAYLLIGGIPEYLKYLKSQSSVFLSLCDHAFKKDSFFSKEYERIFISSLSGNKHFKKIISFLAKRHFATRKEIVHGLKISDGGGLTEVLADLELCGFIEHYVPYNLKKTSMLSRYAIKDAYLQFYYKFIDPIKDQIQNGDHNRHPTKAINQESLRKWMGFSFERFCRKNHAVIASRLGFGAVRYKSGTFFNRKTNKGNSGYQIDLLFERDDKVVTICEIKYYQSKVGTEVIGSFDQKIRKLPEKILNQTIQKVLITTQGITDSLKAKHYFDDVLTLENFFD